MMTCLDSESHATYKELSSDLSPQNLQLTRAYFSHIDSIKINIIQPKTNVQNYNGTELG
jgi:hypothetical protein